ncbi:cell surface protein [Lactiplantibacillus daowaiensis]|uniref:Cell surface protein n=1 Tax=Lactiplantibacillus daowaiensis TaxID=2559918 RepID=A0ABW1S1S9_9LACO|nr:cell surface protein [Lactiplantibacillus daowaiensis]
MRVQRQWWIGLVVVGLVLLSHNMLLAVRADKMMDVMSGTSFQPSRTPGALTATGGSLSYPDLTGVTANNIENGRLTTKTTKIAITFSGSVSISGNNTKMNNLYFDVMTANGVSLRTDKPAIIASGFTSHSFDSFFSSGYTQTISVDLTDLKDKLPVYVGFRYTPSSNPGLNIGYQFGAFPADVTVAAQLKPTIDGKLNATDTVIKGTGSHPGDTISSNVNGVTTTVGSDKTYTLDLGTNLASQNAVTITESNSNGDSGHVTATVMHKTLALTPNQPVLMLGPSDITTEMSDQAVIAWLVKQANFTVNYTDGTPTTQVEFKSEASNLARQLLALTDGMSTTVSIYAQDGANRSASQIVTIRRLQGTLSFGSLSGTLNFEHLMVPVKTTTYAPNGPCDVQLSDTRAPKSTWYLYANATTLTSVTHQLTGDLIYQNGQQTMVMTNQSTLIASGTRGDTATTSITKDWSTNKGIFLRVKPGVYAGQYAGQINWSLQDIPAS